MNPDRSKRAPVGVDIGSHEAAHKACEAEALTPAERVGCCLASVKEDCTRPPCPCNFDPYNPRMTPGIDPPEVGE